MSPAFAYELRLHGGRWAIARWIAVVAASLSMLAVIAPANAYASTGFPTVVEASSAVQVSNCGVVTSRPRELYLWCGRADSIARNVSWYSWSSKSAKAKATANIRNCDPNCAYGSWDKYPISITLTHPARMGGKRVFTRMLVRYLAAYPEYGSREERSYLKWRINYGFMGSQQCKLFWTIPADYNPDGWAPGDPC